MDVLFYSLNSFQIIHIFEDGKAHVFGEELSEHHTFLAVEPDVFNLKSYQILFVQQELVSQEAT